MTDTKKSQKDAEGYEVLELFGIKLRVKNKRIADLLTMDAKEALAEDITVLGKKIGAALKSEMAPINDLPSIGEIESYDDYRGAINTIGERLKFDVGLGGLWKSPTGILMIIKAIHKDVGFDQAKKYATELSTQQDKITNENAGLFVVGSNLSCDIFKAAIRSLNLYSKMRVVSYENLYQVLQLKESGYLKHREVVTLMVPLDNVDVGELLNVIKSAATLTVVKQPTTTKH